MDLEIQGVKIDYHPEKPDLVNEENSQLAKGIILNNTNNDSPLKLLIENSVVQGMQWDGVCTNGLVEIVVDHSKIIQDRTYKSQRGVGVASTFNNPIGKVSINKSTIDYCKGAGIWVNEETGVLGEKPNMQISDTIINNYGWAINLRGNQKTLINNLLISPNYEGASQQDLTYRPLEFLWKGDKFDLSFQNIDFKLNSTMGDKVILMQSQNDDQSQKFIGMTPTDFFKKHFGSWGDLSAKVKYPSENEIEVKIIKEDFFKSLSKLDNLGKPINPSTMQLFFDMKTKQFAVQFLALTDWTDPIFL